MSLSSTAKGVWRHTASTVIYRGNVLQTQPAGRPWKPVSLSSSPERHPTAGEYRRGGDPSIPD